MIHPLRSVEYYKRKIFEEKYGGKKKDAEPSEFVSDRKPSALETPTSPREVMLASYLKDSGSGSEK